MAKSNKPIVWGLFAAGGTVTAFVTPVMIFVTGLAVPLGIMNPDILAMEPKARLIFTAELIHDNDLARAEPSILLLAAQDKAAAKVVKKANKLRLEYVSNTLKQLGFEGDDLAMRAMLYIAYHSWETTVFSDVSRKRRRELIARRVELITSR